VPILKKIILKFLKGEENSNKFLANKNLMKKESVLMHSIKRNVTKTSLLNQLTTKVKLLLLVLIVAK